MKKILSLDRMSVSVSLRQTRVDRHRPKKDKSRAADVSGTGSAQFENWEFYENVSQALAGDARLSGRDVIAGWC